MKKCSRLLSALMIAAVALALLTGSIAAPIIIRPFYYAQIEPLELEQSSGLSREEIIEAYDEVLDYCIGASDEAAKCRAYRNVDILSAVAGDDSFVGKGAGCV